MSAASLTLSQFAFKREVGDVLIYVCFAARHAEFPLSISCDQLGPNYGNVFWYLRISVTASKKQWTKTFDSENEVNSCIVRVVTACVLSWRRWRSRDFKRCLLPKSSSVAACREVSVWSLYIHMHTCDRYSLCCRMMDDSVCGTTFIDCVVVVESCSTVVHVRFIAVMCLCWSDALMVRN